MLLTQTGRRMKMSVFRIEHLSKSFGELTVLKDITTTIEKGEIISIIGPSGTGKSTLLRCLNLLEMPSGGRIFLMILICWPGPRI